ncbi:hypothetical protein [Rhizobium freirei]|nr:hypothetical protein [Rhizobium freirei]
MIAGATAGSWLDRTLMFVSVLGFPLAVSTANGFESLSGDEAIFGIK